VRVPRRCLCDELPTQLSFVGQALCFLLPTTTSARISGRMERLLSTRRVRAHGCRSTLSSVEIHGHQQGLLGAFHVHDIRLRILRRCEVVLPDVPCPASCANPNQRHYIAIRMQVPQQSSDTCTLLSTLGQLRSSARSDRVGSRLIPYRPRSPDPVNPWSA
jgi:hypothetical protein